MNLDAHEMSHNKMLITDMKMKMKKQNIMFTTHFPNCSSLLSPPGTKSSSKQLQYQGSITLRKSNILYFPDY